MGIYGRGDNLMVLFARNVFWYSVPAPPTRGEGCAGLNYDEFDTPRRVDYPHFANEALYWTG